MRTRFELISKNGCSAFYEKLPKLIFAEYILDHERKVVVKHREDDIAGVENRMEELYNYALKGYSNISEMVRNRIENGEPVTLPEWKKMWTNSYERQLLVPLFDLETLIHSAEHCQKNCELLDRPIATTYDEALVHLYVPAILAKLKMIQELKKEAAADQNEDDLVLGYAFRCANL